MLGKLREKTKKISLTLAKPLAALNIHPNIISLSAIPIALTAAYFIFLESYGIAALLALIAVSMDFLDGSVAQLTKKKSYFGNYFETMIDKYVEFILIAGFAFNFPIETALAIGFSLIESYAKPRAALVIISDNRDWPAIGEHADKLCLLIAGMLIAFFVPEITGFKTMSIFLWMLIIMTALGGIQRILYAKKLIKEAEEKGRILPYLKKGFGHKKME